MKSQKQMKTEAEGSAPEDFKNFAPIYTPRGVARFPHLSSPNRRFQAEGSYEVDLLLAEGSDGDKDLSSKIEDHWAAYRDTLSPADIKKLSGVELNFGRRFATEKDGSRSTDKDGNDLVLYRFKMPAMMKRDDVSVPVRPKLVDSKAKLIPQSVNIGGGSELIVSGKMNAYGPKKTVDGKVIAGVKLWLTGAQVLKLVAGSSGPEFSPRDEDDGYTVDEAAESTTQDDASSY